MANKVKIKTKSSAKKRFKLLKSGKVKRQQAKTSHLFSNKTTKAKRHLSKSKIMNESDAKNIRKVL